VHSKVFEFLSVCGWAFVRFGENGKQRVCFFAVKVL
jgi:hypothetical protein